MLEQILRDRGASDATIRDVRSSGYYLRTFGDPFTGRRWTSVSDPLYGNKLFSSVFGTDAFVDYAMGKGSPFEALPAFQTHVVRTREDIDSVLADPRRKHYLTEGSLVFRGQPREYFLKRALPNPVRSNDLGEELSIMPGAYRQGKGPYSIELPVVEQRLVEFLPPELFGTGARGGGPFAYDPMRVEQHYATQTRGLDISFDVEVALFFATHRFKHDDDGKAFYEAATVGGHSGVLYVFRFRDPPVMKEAFLIREFDLFHEHPPERVLRQNCGLPLMSDYERNIAITDLDCIIRLHPDFAYDGKPSPEFLFPSIHQDKFYAKLLHQKDKHPDLFGSVVEYQWAR